MRQGVPLMKRALDPCPGVTPPTHRPDHLPTHDGLDSNRASSRPASGCSNTISPSWRCCHFGCIRSAFRGGSTRDFEPVHGHNASIGASIVTARVIWMPGCATSSSPGSTLCCSSRGAPQRRFRVEIRRDRGRLRRRRLWRVRAGLIRARAPEQRARRSRLRAGPVPSAHRTRPARSARPPRGVRAP
jgi:hypothetical protein